MEAPHLSAISTMTTPNVDSPVTVDFDSVGQRVYWTDASLTSGQLGLHSNHLYGSSFEVIDSSMNSYYFNCWSYISTYYLLSIRNWLG